MTAIDSYLVAGLVVLCVGAGLVAGVFFAFSTFVMKALAQLPARQGIAAMQRINVVVIGPLFLGVFVGTAVLASLGAVAAFAPWVPGRSTLLLVGAATYVVGCFGVTMACNVPRNERLARMDDASPDAQSYWPVYVREWLVWNHVRTASSLVAATTAAAALGY